jgi:hypothetical protein
VSLAVGFAVGLGIVAFALLQDALAAGARAAYAAVLRPIAETLIHGTRRSGAAIRRVAFSVLARAARGPWRRADVAVSDAAGAGPRLVAIDAEAETDESTELPLPHAVDLSERAQPQREELRRRTYVAASSVNVEAAVRTFLAHRTDGAPMEALVRYLDREFGDGLGVGLLESLRARGLVRIQRDRRNPVRLTVRFDPSKAASGTRGG